MEVSKLLSVHFKNYPTYSKVNFSGFSDIPSDSFEISDVTQNRYERVDKIISEMEAAVAENMESSVCFKYPQMFKNRIKNAEFKLGNWEISTGKFFVETQMKALREKFGITNLVPFATEENSNMLACFVVDDDNIGKIVEFDAYGSPNNTDVEKYNNFEEWVFKKL